jgi:hypothetical protein
MTHPDAEMTSTSPTTTESDLNILMSLVAEINAKPIDALTPVDYDVLIAYYRRQRQRRATGERMARGTTRASAATPGVDILGLLALTPKAPTGPKLRR